MVMCIKDKPGSGTAQRRSDGQGGPVFLPPRELSPIARSILSTPMEAERVTAYDELWYRGRPQQA